MSYRSDYLEWCEQWANANLNALPNDARHANAEAVITEYVPRVVKRIRRTVAPELTLKDKVAAIVEEIGASMTKEGKQPLSAVEIGAKLQLALEMLDKGQ
jgi:hypothetical protein